jgi:hypothetical protein
MDATERAAKSVAQAALLALGVGSATIGFDVVTTDWVYVASFAAGGAVLSYLTSIISAARGDSGSASFVNTEPKVTEVEVDEKSLDEDFWVNDELPKE